MKTDRELIALAKTHTLEAIADELKRPPAYILKRSSGRRRGNRRDGKAGCLDDRGRDRCLRGSLRARSIEGSVQAKMTGGVRQALT
jgi:hypothetical protein